jgi:hypothetical protein
MIRQLMISCTVLAGLAFAGAASAQEKYDLTNPDDIFKATMKRSCTSVEGTPVIHWWEGKTYSRRPGEKDRHLFNVQGMNIRACKFFNDPKRGVGYRSVSREVMFHMDPQTGEILKTWKNPWTGETVDVIQVNNDPVNMREPTYARDAEGKPTMTEFRMFAHDGFYLSGGGAARLFYKNPMAGEYQEYVGGDYHAMEFGTDASNMAQVLDPKADVEDSVLSWGRVSKWLPWMKMGDRDGVVIYHTAGIRVKTFDELPEPLKGEILANYPIYQQPPPLNDPRPNETTWTVVKDVVDGKRQDAADKAK